MSRKFIYKYSFLLVVCLCLVGCKGELVDEYCHHEARFRIDFQGHTQSYLYAALTSTNYFSFVTTQLISGGPEYNLITEVYGNKEPNVEPITESILTKNGRALGLNNGLIVGRSSFQNNELYVFDRQCPNCFNETSQKKYALKFQNSANVICDRCKRVYGLLNGGVVVADEIGHDVNEKLFRYRATFSGTYFEVANQ